MPGQRDILIGRHAVPAGGFGIIFFNALAVVIHRPQKELGLRVASLGQRKPLIEGLGIFLVLKSGPACLKIGTPHLTRKEQRKKKEKNEEKISGHHIILKQSSLLTGFSDRRTSLPRISQAALDRTDPFPKFLIRLDAVIGH